MEVDDDMVVDEEVYTLMGAGPTYEGDDDAMEEQPTFVRHIHNPLQDEIAPAQREIAAEFYARFRPEDMRTLQDQLGDYPADGLKDTILGMELLLAWHDARSEAERNYIAAKMVQGEFLASRERNVYDAPAHQPTDIEELRYPTQADNSQMEF